MWQGEEEGEILGTHLKLAAGQVGLIILCEMFFSCLLNILMAGSLERAFPNHAWAKERKASLQMAASGYFYSEHQGSGLVENYSM